VDFEFHLWLLWAPSIVFFFQATPSKLAGPLQPWANPDALITAVRSALESVANNVKPKVIILGAKGRSGSGAVWAAEQCGLEMTAWDLEETKAGGPFDEILTHDIFVNCVYLMPGVSIPPFLTLEGVAKEDRKLTVLADVSCDPTSPDNVVPVYKDATTLEEPVVRVVDGEKPFDVVAIDHMPTLVPTNASEDFSASLTPALNDLLKENGQEEGMWKRATAKFEEVEASM
jgi:saccharopine dehydrogenase (NAD+, L-lysine-forming)